MRVSSRGMSHESRASMNAKGLRPRFTEQTPLGIAISDSLEETGNWDAEHLNYAFLSRRRRRVAEAGTPRM